ncbi:MAG TPA: ATP-binding protein [Candidatus Limnocylindrales bacterium]|nr:ATP-binding protein [Candidatus Limnocylindrales bacterium]
MTIRTRLALIYFGAIVVTIGLVGILVWWQLRTALRSALDQTLETRAAAAVTGLENNGQSGLQEGDAAGPPGVFVVVLDERGQIVDATPGVPVGFLAPSADLTTADVVAGGSTYATHTVTADGGLRVVAGSDLTAISATLDRLAGSLVAVGAIAAIASLAGGWWIAGRALHPVALITAEASQIGAVDIERRLPVPSRNDELRALATTLNAMLDRVADAIRRQRTFVAAASHDLRTPIAALQAELELAEDARTTDEELRAAVRAAHGDAVRLGDLATGLLDLAAADADGRALVRSPVRADLLIESVVRRVAPVARERDVSLSRSAPGRLIRVDRLRLEQALTNLVVNAITYGPEHGEVGIKARFDDIAEPAPTETETLLTIEVLDRGRGVPAEFADRLFEPFHRGPNAAGGGTGLGLATAAAALKAHHGSIGYESRPDGGTRFWIRLPV